MDKVMKFTMWVLVGCAVWVLGAAFVSEHADSARAVASTITMPKIAQPAKQLIVIMNPPIAHGCSDGSDLVAYVDGIPFTADSQTDLLVRCDEHDGQLPANLDIRLADTVSHL